MQRYYFVNKGPSSQGYGFTSGHVWMWELDYKESWAPKNWCFWPVVLEKTLESPLDCKEIQPVHPKGHQSWMFIGRTDVEPETPILRPPDAKSWLILKRPWCWERLRSGGEGDNRGWDGWMASLTQRTWVWVNSGSWWWTGRPGVLRFMESQRVRHDCSTELNWTDRCKKESHSLSDHPEAATVVILAYFCPEFFPHIFSLSLSLPTPLSPLSLFYVRLKQEGTYLKEGSHQDPSMPALWS